MDGLVAIVILFFVVSSVVGNLKKAGKKQESGREGQAARRPAAPPSRPAQPRPQGIPDWRTVAQMFTGGEDDVDSPAQGESLEDERGCVGGSLPHEKHEGQALPGGSLGYRSTQGRSLKAGSLSGSLPYQPQESSQMAPRALTAASATPTVAHAARPALTGAQLRQAVVMAEVLGAPKGRRGRVRT